MIIELIGFLMFLTYRIEGTGNKTVPFAFVKK